MGKWLVANINSRTDDLERTIGMCSAIRSVDKRIEFGLRFVVRDHGEEVFLQFVDSFSSLQSKGKRSPKPDFIRPVRHGEEQSLVSSTSTVCYTYHMRGFGRNQELWMFSELAKLDWSKFSFEFPRAEGGRGSDRPLSRDGSVRIGGEDEFGNDMLLGSGDEIGALISDNEDDEDQQENLNEGVFVADDDPVLLDAGVNGSLVDSEEEDQHNDDEDEL
jgi:hypothetical protein